MTPTHSTSTSLGVRSGTDRARPIERPAQWLAGLALAVLVAAGCGSDDDDPAAAPDAVVEASGTTEATREDGSAGLADAESAAADEAAEQAYPDVIDAVAEQSPDGTWRFDVTISSPYDSPDRYADAWRVLGLDGTELGVRVLTHDHANEQPFTRSLRGVGVPDGIDTVVVEGRDLVNGWGGRTFELDLPR